MLKLFTVLWLILLLAACGDKEQTCQNDFNVEGIKEPIFSKKVRNNTKYDFHNGNWLNFKENMRTISNNNEVSLLSIYLFDPNEELWTSINKDKYIDTDKINHKGSRYYRFDEEDLIEWQYLDKLSDFLRSFIEVNIDDYNTPDLIQARLIVSNCKILDSSVYSEYQKYPMVVAAVANLIAHIPSPPINTENLVIVLEFTVNEKGFLEAKYGNKNH